MCIGKFNPSNAIKFRGRFLCRVKNITIDFFGAISNLFSEIHLFVCINIYLLEFQSVHQKCRYNIWLRLLRRLWQVAQRHLWYVDIGSYRSTYLE